MFRPDRLNQLYIWQLSDLWCVFVASTNATTNIVLSHPSSWWRNVNKKNCLSEKLKHIQTNPIISLKDFFFLLNSCFPYSGFQSDWLLYHCPEKWSIHIVILISSFFFSKENCCWKESKVKRNMLPRGQHLGNGCENSRMLTLKSVAEVV